jgi:hypothetical protein
MLRQQKPTGLGGYSKLQRREGWPSRALRRNGFGGRCAQAALPDLGLLASNYLVHHNALMYHDLPEMLIDEDEFPANLALHKSIIQGMGMKVL